jgi:hypothetical protein
LLRLAIVLLGLQLTVQQIASSILPCPPCCILAPRPMGSGQAHRSTRSRK